MYTVTNNEEHTLTILLHTFNRINYLKEAIRSCSNQKNNNFNLVIIDNASTDGTSEFLSKLPKSASYRTTILTNPINIDLYDSIYMNLNKITGVNWITILCDDDILGDDFVNQFYSSKNQAPTASCFVFSTAEIDHQSIIKNKFINPDLFFTPVQAYKAISKGLIRPAGVSGFIFKSDFYRNIFFPISQYPKGYLVDTLLFVLASIQSGLHLSSNTCYLRRLWPEQTSSYSNENSLNYFTALLIFDNDLRQRLAKNGFNDVLTLHKTMNLFQFFRIVQFPIIALGYLTFNLCINYLITSLRYNKRYIPHALSMFILWPFTTKYSLNFRIKINRIRKTIKNLFM